MPNYLDLFAGAGGLSEGFWRAGFEPVAHIEMDRAACFTLKTRVAYKWLQAHGQAAIYHQHHNNKSDNLKYHARHYSNDLQSLQIFSFQN